jgi:AsmA protein
MKRAIGIAGLLLSVLLVAAIATPFLLDANQFRPLLQTKLSAALGREVTLGGLKLSLFSGSVTASDVSIADDPAFSAAPFLRASSLEAGVELMPLLFSRKLKVVRIAVDRPQIELAQNAEGVWNFSSIGAKSAVAQPAATSGQSSEMSSASDLSVRKIKVSNGRIALTKAGSQAPPLILDQVNIEVKDFSTDAPFTFLLTADFTGRGDIKLDGKAGPIDTGIKAGNAIATPLNATLRITHLDLGLSGAVDPALGLGGIASIDGSVQSSGASALISGKLKGEQLKLVKAGLPATRPLEVDFALRHDLTKQSGTVNRGDIHLGDAIASLTGDYDVSGETPVLDVRLTGSRLDVGELSAFLPALNIILPEGASIDQGTAELNFVAEGPADKLVAVGTIGLDSVRLTNFDLVTKLSMLDEMAGIKAGRHTEIQTFHATLKTAPDGSQVEDIELVVPSIGHISGAGTVSPAHELAFKMRAAIHSGMGALASLGSKGGVPFTVSGTSNKPSFKADVKALTKDKFKDLEGLVHGKKKSKSAEDDTLADPGPP